LQAFGEQANEVEYCGDHHYERTPGVTTWATMVTPKEIFDYKSQQQQWTWLPAPSCQPRPLQE